MQARKVIALLVAAIFLSSLLSFYAFSPDLSYTTVIEEGTMNTEASYVIFIDDSSYYARNGETGAIDYSSTNASAVIQYGIDNGAWTHISEGLYPDVQLIVEDSSIMVTGAGRQTILNTTLNARVIWNKGTPGAHLHHNTFRNFMINGSGTGANQRGIELQYTDLSTVDNVWVENIGYDSFLIIDNSLGNQILNSYSASSGDDSFNINNASHRNQILGCYATGATHDSYHISQGSHNNIVDGSVSISAGEYGVHLYPDAGCNFNTISNNEIILSGIDGILLNDAERNTIVGNTLDDNTGIGIKLYNASHYNVISGNNIYESTRGIWSDSASGANHYNVITGNHLDYNVNYGIAITGGHKTDITGNLVKNTQNYDGILVDAAADKNCLTGNTVVDNTRYGININSSDCDYTLVVGNTVMDNVSPDIRDEGTNSQIHSCWNNTAWIT